MMLRGRRHRCVQVARYPRLTSVGRRRQHESSNFNAVVRSSPAQNVLPVSWKDTTNGRPLKQLSSSHILRSLVVLSTTSMPSAILRPFMRGFRKYARLILKLPQASWVMKNTFYSQFCCGSSDREIQKKLADLKRLGFSGAIMAYARELPTASDAGMKIVDPEVDINFWLENNLRTIELTDPASFVAIKYTGAGLFAAQRLRDLSDSLPGETATPSTLKECTKAFGNIAEAISTISAAAKSRGVRLLIDAETQATQRATDSLTLALMAHFNKDGKAVVYNTYQMYLKATPTTLASHLAASRDHGFTTGIKLVRGAYLRAERERDASVIHDIKADTDAAYDTALSLLLSGGVDRMGGGEGDGWRFFVDGQERYPGVWGEVGVGEERGLEPGEWRQLRRRHWRADVVVATHNKASVRTALEIQERCAVEAVAREQEGPEGEEVEGSAGLKEERDWSAEIAGEEEDPRALRPGRVTDVAYAQLLGMADELSMQLCSLRQRQRGTGAGFEVQCYKYATWGTLDECVLYLLRRAEENGDALERTKETAREMERELRKRLWDMVV